MAHRCPGAVPCGAGRLDGWELVFRRGYLTIERNYEAFVPVGCWRISDEDEAQLDRYEGYPKFYYKEDFLIKCDDGKVRRFMAYIMQDGHPIQKPSESYLLTVAKGYADFGFDQQPLKDAYYHTTVYTTKDDPE